MIIVPDREPGLFKASGIATLLHTSRRIQGWDLSDECAGIVINLYPRMAVVVIEKGGPDEYRKWVLDQFVLAGYKEYDPTAVQVELPAKPRTRNATKSAVRMD